ncbi:hypothetical protein Pmani_010706 [Petrolisthes manimaculis]|uniref:Threonine synthase-like 2 n=1 Tax=Petrolisthes manimaculis TaxID=1843537 RepID=A0AAE1Q270_9EUCA|nr:hypothetical protein Pmani_010706 [Petrolisthes manimaculis]
MKYCSSRGLESGLSFRDVLFAGYAKDGGLYVPEELPKLTLDELKSMAHTSYPGLVFEMARKFISEQEISSVQLKDLIDNNIKKFTTPEVVEIKQLNGELNIVELFHGPTLAFKDLALSVVGRLLNFYLKENQQNITILVGTSGDTGSSALMSVRGEEHTDIVVLLPHGRCTRTQELQMTTIIDDNVHIYRVEGNSDELDEPIKKCFHDESFVANHNLISINSINWGRVMVQIAHYFYSYFRLCGEVGEVVQLLVPTGAAGNITAGCIAQKMGLPITMVATVNTNDIVARTLSCGDFSVKGEVVKSLAPAMDIQVSYNIERLLYFFTDQDRQQVRCLMEEFERENRVRVPEDVMTSLKQTVVETFVASDDDIKSAMRRVYEENKYVVCPHTAVAAAYYYYQNESVGVPRGVLATAAPDKFPEAVAESEIPVRMDSLQHLETMPTKSVWMRKGEDWYGILRTKIEEITDRRKSKSKEIKKG